MIVNEIMGWLFYSPMLTGAALSSAFAWSIIVFCLFFPWSPKKAKEDVAKKKGDSPVNVI